MTTRNEDDESRSLYVSRWLHSNKRRKVARAATQGGSKPADWPTGQPVTEIRAMGP